MEVWAELSVLSAGKPKGKLGKRGQRGCVCPLSFVTQRDDFAYVATDRSRMDLSATAKVWIHNATLCSQRFSCSHWKTSSGLHKPSKANWSCLHSQEGVEIRQHKDFDFSFQQSQNKNSEAVKSLLLSGKRQTCASESSPSIEWDTTDSAEL